MPTPYTPDPLVAQAPSPAPAPENLPILNLPLGPEGRNVSSIAQAFKTLGDHLAWLKVPRGVTSLATQFIQRWKNSGGRTRFGLDRFGFPAASVIQWREWWTATGTYNAATVVNYLEGLGNGWRKHITGTGALLIRHSGLSHQAHGHAQVDAGTLAGHACTIESSPAARFYAGLECAVEFSVMLSHTGMPGLEVLAGINGVDFTDSSCRGKWGLRFIAISGTANWQASTHDGSSETLVDTGVPTTGSADTRFRIEYRGSAVNEGGAAAALFFIDGVHKATITTTLPTTTPGGGLDPATNVVFSSRVTNASIAASTYLAQMGPVHFACAWSPFF